MTSITWQRRRLFTGESWAMLLINTLLHYRCEHHFLLHEFVIMPDHFHLLLTPTGALERAMQMIKGGFSFRARKELGSNLEIWQHGYTDHRVRDADDYAKCRDYPVRARLVSCMTEYPYSSAHSEFAPDDVPQRLKPLVTAN